MEQPTDLLTKKETLNIKPPFHRIGGRTIRHIRATTLALALVCSGLNNLGLPFGLPVKHGHGQNRPKNRLPVFFPLTCSSSFWVLLRVSISFVFSVVAASSCCCKNSFCLLIKPFCLSFSASIS